MKMKNDAKLEIVNAILGKFVAANETVGGVIYSDPKKIILDFIPHISSGDHLAILKELKNANAIKDFESGEDCFYILKPSKSKLYEIKQSLSFAPTQKPTDAAELRFDLNNGKILWGEKECELPFKKIEYYIAKALFEPPPETKIKENDLVTYLDSEACEADSPSRIYDGTRRINQRVLKDLGIKNLILYKAANYWIRKTE